MLCAPRGHKRFSLHGTEWGLLGHCLVLKLSLGRSSALPPPASGRAPCSEPAQRGWWKAGAAVRLSPRAGCAARGFPNACSAGVVRRLSAAEGNEAAVRRSPAPCELGRWSCSRGRVTVAAGAASAALLRGYGEAERRGRLLGRPPTPGPAGSLPRASASTRRAHSLALGQRGLHAQGRSAPGFLLGGKAVVLTRAFQAQLSEGMLLRGATSAGWCCWHATLSGFSQGAPGGRNSGHATEAGAANSFPPPRRSAAPGEPGPTARALRPHEAGRFHSPACFSLRTRLSPDVVLSRSTVLL